MHAYDEMREEEEADDNLNYMYYLLQIAKCKVYMQE